jgi:transcriptional regulator with XRE-family HTH domain
MDRLYGSRLRSVRTERKLRQVDVAAGLGMTAGGYSSIERGYARMFVADLPRYAEALGVAPEYLARRLGLCGDDQGPDIAQVLVGRFGPNVGTALVELDRILVAMERDDEVALSVMVRNTTRKYQRPPSA